MNEETKKALKELYNVLSKLYLAGNQNLLLFWRKIIEKNPEKRWSIALRTLLDTPATALLLNTILFATVGKTFGGLIESVLFFVSMINIVFFCLTFFKK